MSQTVTRTIRLSPADNVVVARAALRADTRVEEEALTTLDPIDPGHKVATQAISKGDTIRKYDQIIGIAETDILPGQHVHTHNLRMDNFDRDYRFSESVRSLDFVAPEQAATFEGIVRSDGRVGTRNYIGVLTSVNCSASVARHVTKRFQEDVMAEFPNVDGVIALTHDHGCGGCAGIGLNYIQRTLSGYSRHPNFYAVVIIGLGCEANQIGAMMEAEKLNPSDKLHAFTIQDSGGSAAAAERGEGLIRELLSDANQIERVTRPVSDLILALECGGSDGYSGISANPALGAAADLLVLNGGRPVWVKRQKSMVPNTCSRSGQSAPKSARNWWTGSVGGKTTPRPIMPK